MQRRPFRLRTVSSSLVVGLTALAVGLTWSAPPAAASAKDTKLSSSLTKVLQDSRVTRGDTAVAVVDAKDGRAIFGRTSKKALTPASNTKIVTAAAALDTLGSNYRFQTKVIRRGKVVGGTLRGALYLKGYGDPTTMEKDYASLAAQVRAKGISKITGRVVADASFFDSDRYNDTWSTSYDNDYYAAQISGLTVASDDDLDSGTVILRYTAGSKKGAKSKVTVLPASARSYVKVINKTSTKTTGLSTVRGSRAAGSRTYTVTGSMRKGSASYNQLITVNRPDLYAAAVFEAQLAAHGVTVGKASTSGRLPAGQHARLATDYSMPISQLMVPFLKLSNNMHAEALTKAMGRKRSNSGSWSAGLAATRAYLTKVGVPTRGLVLTDGSGLTRSNKISPATMTSLLVQARKEPWFAAFRNGLPVAGVRERMVGGTLRNRMNGTAAAGDARAKTGTLTGVTALSGYVTDADGRLFAFSMISNYAGSTPRPVEDELVEKIAAHRR